MTSETEITTLVKRIAGVGGKIEVNRIGATVANGFLRLLSASRDVAVRDAVEVYLSVARRLPEHPDAMSLKRFIDADEVLTRHLAGLGTEAEALRLELAQRRICLLEDPAKLEAAVRAAREAAEQRLARGGVVEDVDLVAALIQHTFFDSIRALSNELRLGSIGVDGLQTLRAYRKMRAVVGADWAEGWQDTFTYLRKNAAAISEQAEPLSAALDRLRAARRAGDPVAVKEAESALGKVRSRSAHNNIKGLLGEAYISRWPKWRIQRDSFLEVAERVAAERPGGWQAIHFDGTVRLHGSEAWDEVILLVRPGRAGQPPEANLFLAGQHKVEKYLTALQQTENDALVRETARAQSKPLIMTLERNGRLQGTYVLTLPPPGQPTYRYVFNASGAKAAQTHITRLKTLGIKVHQMTLDASIDEFNAIADALMLAVGKLP